MRHGAIRGLAGAAMAVLCACGGPSENGVPNGGSSAVAVTNRVNIGENQWIVEPGAGRANAGVGAVESFEIVNDTGEEIVPDVGLNRELFNITSNSCLQGVKPGQKCIVRGEWLAAGARAATLNVAVSNPSDTGASTKRITVPLEPATSTAAPAKRTVAPTPGPTATATTTSTATSTATGSATPTGTSTPTGSATARDLPTRSAPPATNNVKLGD
ncbi:hypothetical protein AB0P28_03630 [Pseudarthrobacter sp. NPDC089323]